MYTENRNQDKGSVFIYFIQILFETSILEVCMHLILTEATEFVVF